MKISFTFSFLMAIFIYSCAPTVSKQKESILNAKVIDNPELNSVSKREVGETMVESSMYYQKPAIQIESLPESKSSKINVKVGDIFPYVMTQNGRDFFYDQTLTGVSINEKTGKAAYYTAHGSITPVGKQQIAYKKVFVDAIHKDSFKREFIYNGKSGNTVKFTYREFKDDMARPAFTQDLQYDLSESKTIGFRGMRIEIIEANNIEISYKLINKFN